eukprot:scaffold49_cov409-Prasinococcus_capsulatus_cf.AAC.5
MRTVVSAALPPAPSPHCRCYCQYHGHTDFSTYASDRAKRYHFLSRACPPLSLMRGWVRR